MMYHEATACHVTGDLVELLSIFLSVLKATRPYLQRKGQSASLLPGGHLQPVKTSHLRLSRSLAERFPELMLRHLQCSERFYNCKTVSMVTVCLTEDEKLLS